MIFAHYAKNKKNKGELMRSSLTVIVYGPENDNVSHEIYYTAEVVWGPEHKVFLSGRLCHSLDDALNKLFLLSARTLSGLKDSRELATIEQQSNQAPDHCGGKIDTELK